jgi:hypothetical protein
MYPNLQEIGNVSHYICEEASKKGISVDTKDLFDSKILKFMKENYGDELRDFPEKFAVIPLPYYYKLYEQLGSLENLATTCTHTVKHPGWYSIYFCVVGKKWSKGEFSAVRMVHDKVLVTSVGSRQGTIEYQ